MACAAPWQRFLFRLFVWTMVVAAPRPAAAITDIAVAFEVRNVNRSLVPCAADLQTYTIAGRLVAPDAMPGSVALYLHGLGYGKWFWGFQAVPGFDFAADMAGRGHASVIIDRLGYDDSGHPNGYASCLGAQADVAHQIIDEMHVLTPGDDAEAIVHRPSVVNIVVPGDHDDRAA
ncbi:MAG: hypothetical protein ACREQY_07515, partial [Candidatus Binatia bacterium]